MVDKLFNQTFELSEQISESYISYTESANQIQLNKVLDDDDQKQNFDN